MGVSTRVVRRRPAVLQALGSSTPPAVVTIGDERHELVETFKHDSWAATALYRGAQDQVVVKFHPQNRLFLLPISLLGRWLASREQRARRLLNGVPGIARDAGVVPVRGEQCPNAVAHYYIEGHPLPTNGPASGFSLV